MSDVQSELSTSHLQTPTPYFGERYSQGISSPDHQCENIRNGCTSNYTSAEKKGVASETILQNAHLPQQCMGEGTVNFVDNDAYETTEFVISGGEKGALRETMLMKTK